MVPVSASAENLMVKKWQTSGYVPKRPKVKKKQRVSQERT
jgi:hypothetical protein